MEKLICNSRRGGAKTSRFARVVVLALAGAVGSVTVSASDLESYRFRYDFSSGEKVFFGSAAVSTDFVTTSAAYAPVYGPDGADTAVHPTLSGYGAIGTSTMNADWTLAMHVRPGSVEGGVLLGLGRLNNDNKKSVVFSASSDPTKFKVYVEKRIPSNKRSHETTLTLDVGNTTGFHSIVAVHHAPPSGNKGMLQIYWDGVLKATYTMTTDIPFGDLMQFCSSPSYLVSPCVSSTENPDVAFHDLRFFSRAFTAADAVAYAAKFPAGTLRQCAYVQSARIRARATRRTSGISSTRRSPASSACAMSPDATSTSTAAPCSATRCATAVRGGRTSAWAWTTAAAS